MRVLVTAVLKKVSTLPTVESPPMEDQGMDYASLLMMSDPLLAIDAPSSMTSSTSSLKGLETLREGEVHNGLNSASREAKDKKKEAPKEVSTCLFFKGASKITF